MIRTSKTSSPRAKQVSYPRPKLSAPRGAAVCAVLMYLAWGSVAPITAIAFGAALRISYDLLEKNFLIVLIISSAPIVIVTLGLRAGTIWSIFTIRYLTYASLIMALVDVCAGTLLATRTVGFQEVKSQHLGLFVCICASILLALSIALYRLIRRVRWMDPYSTPNDWETPVNRTARTPI